MWDDPLFNSEAESFLKFGQNDPAWLTEKRREMTLGTLNVLFARISQLEADVKKISEQAIENRCRCTWIFQTLAAHVPDSMAEQVHVDIRVNDMDPDFSWQRAVGL